MMSNVHHITPHLLDVEAPAAIRNLPAWLIWRLEDPGHGAKPRKVPYYAGGGRRVGTQGAPEDLDQLVTFDEAKAAAARKGFAGVGFAVLPQWQITALDFDDCLINGAIHQDLEPLAMQTYAELSPSGKGVRMFFAGSLNSNSKSLEGDEYGMEVFSTRGYVTFTGNALPIVEILGNTQTIAPLTREAAELYHQRFGPQERDTDRPRGEPFGLTPEIIARCLEALPLDLHYDEWLAVGMAIHCETRGEGFEIWEDWSAKSPKYTSRRYNQDRWRSFGRGTGPVVTGRSLVRLANKYGAGIDLNGPASADEFETLVDDEPEPDDVQDLDATERLRFHFEPVHEFSSTQGLPWMIKGVLPKAGLAVIYGASGSGKTFAVLDMAMSIARGEPWRGNRVKQGRVAYVVAEGADGFRKRLAAYAQHHHVDLTEVPMVILNAAPNLLEKQDAVDLVKGVKASGGADIIVIDTFAQTTPGANENAGEDVGRALSYCKRIHETTGAMVVLIHHSGKDASKGARGWSGLRAAADAEIEVVREPEGARYLRLSKSKDGEDGLEWGFELKVVELGVDEDLDVISSCSVIEVSREPKESRQNARKLGPVETVVNEVIHSVMMFQQDGIEVETVVEESVKRMEVPADGKRDTRRQRVKRAIETLTTGDDSPFLIDEDGLICLC